MLRIVFGEAEEVLYGPVWFDYNYEREWFEDEYVQRMIEDIDKSRYIDGEYIESEVLGPISPRDLSGGVKTLIAMYKNRELIYDATSCGENCAKWIIDMGKRMELTINLRYLMRFKEYEPFELYIINTKTIVRTNREYVDVAINYV